MPLVLRVCSRSLASSSAWVRGGTKAGQRRQAASSDTLSAILYTLDRHWHTIRFALLPAARLSASCSRSDDVPLPTAPGPSPSDPCPPPRRARPARCRGTSCSAARAGLLRSARATRRKCACRPAHRGRARAPMSGDAPSSWLLLLGARGGGLRAGGTRRRREQAAILRAVRCCSGRRGGAREHRCSAPAAAAGSSPADWLRPLEALSGHRCPPRGRCGAGAHLARCFQRPKAEQGLCSSWQPGCAGPASALTRARAFHALGGSSRAG